MADSVWFPVSSVLSLKQINNSAGTFQCSWGPAPEKPVAMWESYIVDAEYRRLCSVLNFLILTTWNVLGFEVYSFSSIWLDPSCNVKMLFTSTNRNHSSTAMHRIKVQIQITWSRSLKWVWGGGNRFPRFFLLSSNSRLLSTQSGLHVVLYIYWKPILQWARIFQRLWVLLLLDSQNIVWP